jgi:hypothetical protein
MVIFLASHFLKKAVRGCNHRLFVDHHPLQVSEDVASATEAEDVKTSTHLQEDVSESTLHHEEVDTIHALNHVHSHVPEATLVLTLVRAHSQAPEAILAVDHLILVQDRTVEASLDHVLTHPVTIKTHYVYKKLIGKKSVFYI